MEYPLLVESYGLIEDSGGAGRQRGGLGLRRVVRPVGHATVFNGMGERFVHRPWGIFGAEAGGTGRFVLLGANGDETALPDKPTSIVVPPEQAVVVETPGAGGYGPPAEREARLLEQDWQTGKFSRDYLMKHYGYRPPAEPGHGDD